MAAPTGIIEETVPHARLVVYPSPLRAAVVSAPLTVGLFALGGFVATQGGTDQPGPLVVGAVLVLAGLGCLALVLRPLWTGRRPLLTVDGAGITDPAAGTVRWADVAEIVVEKRNHNRFVVVRVWDPRMLLESGVSVPKRARSNLRWFGGPIVLANVNFPGSPRRLIAAMERYRP